MELSKPPDPPFVVSLSRFAPGQRSFEERLRRVLRDEIARCPSGSLDVVGDIVVGATLTVQGRSVGGSVWLGLAIFIAGGEHDHGAATDVHVVRT